jgi:hypothetical protein
VLINKKIITPGRQNYFLYGVGITVGTLAGFALFIYGGNYIIAQAVNSQQLINWVVGTVLFLTALVQLYKIISNPVAIKLNIRTGTE